MNIINRDLNEVQLKEVEEVIKDQEKSLGVRCDLMLVLEDGEKVLLVKRDNTIIVQTLAYLEF